MSKTEVVTTEQDLIAFEDLVIKKYPTIGHFTALSKAVRMNLLAGKLTSEAGELSELFAKELWYSPKDIHHTHDDIMGEFSDTLYMLIACLHEYGISLDDLAGYATHKFLAKV